MKKSLGILVFLTSISGFANNQNLRTMSDIATIVESPEVRKVLVQTTGFLKSIHYAGTARCIGGPSDYKLTFDSSNTTCTIGVTVGTCLDASDRSTVSVDSVPVCLARD